MDSVSILERHILDGHRLGHQEAVDLARNTPVEVLCGLADRLRRAFTGDQMDTCSIINARSGRCTEDCKWCSQSKFHTSDIDVYPLIDSEQALDMARHRAASGVRRFSLVTSGKALSGGDIERSCHMLEVINSNVDIELCASMGLLNAKQLGNLYESGVRRYHCNLESAPSHFAQLCTTHTIEEKIVAIKAAQEVGMEVCSGGIIGMGETLEQRVELAITLRELGIRSVPLNILNPIVGTALEGEKMLTDSEILVSFAMFRIINPSAHLRFAGGRKLIKHLERRLLRGGVSASILGDMLTTSGSDIEADMEMFTSEGFVV